MTALARVTSSAAISTRAPGTFAVFGSGRTYGTTTSIKLRSKAKLAFHASVTLQQPAIRNRKFPSANCVDYLQEFLRLTRDSPVTILAIAGVVDELHRHKTVEPTEEPVLKRRGRGGIRFDFR